MFEKGDTKAFQEHWLVRSLEELGQHKSTAINSRKGRAHTKKDKQRLTKQAQDAQIFFGITSFKTAYTTLSETWQNDLFIRIMFHHSDELTNVSKFSLEEKTLLRYIKNRTPIETILQDPFLRHLNKRDIEVWKNLLVYGLPRRRPTVDWDLTVEDWQKREPKGKTT